MMASTIRPLLSNSKTVCRHFLRHIFYQGQDLFPPVGRDQGFHHVLDKKSCRFNALCHRDEAVSMGFFQEEDGGKRGGAGGNVRQVAMAPGPVDAQPVRPAGAR